MKANIAFRPIVLAIILEFSLVNNLGIVTSSRSNHPNLSPEQQSLISSLRRSYIRSSNHERVNIKPEFRNARSPMQLNAVSSSESSASNSSTTFTSDSELSSRPKWSASTEFCKSDSCKSFAETFLSKLDWNSWCCDDFYDFVCRKTLNPDTQNASSNSSLKDAQTINSLSYLEIEENIKSLIDSKRDSTGRTPRSSANLKRLRNMYESCKFARENHQSLIDLIRGLGGFSLAGARSGWNDQVPFDWLAMTIRFRELGLNLDQFFDFGTYIDEKHYRLKIGITKQDSLSSTLMAADIIESLYSQDQSPAHHRRPSQPSNMAVTDAQLKELTEFRSDLRQIVRSHNGSIEHHSLEKLQLMIPEINWLKLLAAIVTRKDKLLDHSIIIEDRGKLEALAKLLSQTNPEVLANHMMLSIMDYIGPYTKKVGKNGSSEPFFKKTQSLDCLQVLRKYLGLALSVDYYENYVTSDLIRGANEIISSIKTEMKLMIDEAVWFTDKTETKHKIDSITFNFGVTEELEELKIGDSFYKKLELDRVNIIDNLLRINKVKYSVYLNEILNEETRMFEWIKYDSEAMNKVDAEYKQFDHKIHLPIGFMNTKYLDSTRLYSINYAIFGTKVAHEMIIALGLRQIMEDPKKTKSGVERLEWLRNQYNGLKPEDAKWVIDGDATLVRNLADNAGVDVAYRAFSRYSQAHRSQPRLLRGIPLMSRQLFWTSYAVAMCRSFSNQRQFDALRSGPQSPPKFRVNIPLRNYESFSSDFECPLESKMSAKEKFAIWLQAMSPANMTVLLTNQS